MMSGTYRARYEDSEIEVEARVAGLATAQYSLVIDNRRVDQIP